MSGHHHRILWDRIAEADSAYHLAWHGHFAGSSPLHTHDFAELFWVDAGSAVHVVGGHGWPVAAGELVLVRPEDVHGFRDPSTDFAITNLAFPRSVLDDLRERYYPGGGLPWAAPAPRTVRLPPTHLLALVRSGRALSLGAPARLRLDRFLLALLDDLPTAAPGPTSAPTWLRTAMAGLAADPEALRAGVRGLARRAGRSREHVSRVIRDVTGRRALDVVNDARLDAAAAALRMTDRPIPAIAADIGIASLGHFYRLFRTRFATTPHRYRRDHRTVVEPQSPPPT